MKSFVKAFCGFAVIKVIGADNFAGLAPAFYLIPC